MTAHALVEERAALPRRRHERPCDEADRSGCAVCDSAAMGEAASQSRASEPRARAPANSAAEVVCQRSQGSTSPMVSSASPATGASTATCWRSLRRSKPMRLREIAAALESGDRQAGRAHRAYRKGRRRQHRNHGACSRRLRELEKAIREGAGFGPGTARASSRALLGVQDRCHPAGTARLSLDNPPGGAAAAFQWRERSLCNRRLKALLEASDGDAARGISIDLQDAVAEAVDKQ